MPKQQPFSSSAVNAGESTSLLGSSSSGVAVGEYDNYENNDGGDGMMVGYQQDHGMAINHIGGGWFEL